MMKPRGLHTKISLIAIISVITTVTALVSLTVWQSKVYNSLARAEVETLISSNLDGIAEGVYNLVKTEDQAVQQQVNMNLNVARAVLEGYGKPNLSGETVSWRAVNQYTGKMEELKLPKMYAGDTWLGQNRNPDMAAPVVDDVRALVGDTVTIFQRMNLAGDMLRVATNVVDSRGNRAVGTYIPALEPDGKPNAVVETILAGGTYRGRAYVVNDWYLTAYEPLYGEQGEILGMLYVGVQQRNVEERIRQAILQTRVGKTGYVYILGGRGADRGRYIISRRGERDGEDVWDVRDRQGNYVIRDIVDTAIALRPGELATVRYLWQNPGEEYERWKIARLAYYEPWDWVIGASVYEDELQHYWAVLHNGRIRMIHSMAATGFLIILGAVAGGLLIARKITRPVTLMTRAAETITRGNYDVRVPETRGDEIGELAKTFNYMTGCLKETLEGLQNTRDELSGALADVERSLHEIHHRVRNNLQIMISMIHLQTTVYDDTHLQSILKEIENRIRSMAIVHDVAYQAEYLSRIDFAAYVRQIGGYLIMSYNIQDHHITLEQDIADITLDISRAIPCALAVNELITNALCHGFPGGRKGRILVEMRRAGKEEILLRVSDNGIGLPPGLNTDSFETLGLMLVENLVRQLDGTLTIDSGTGTRVTIIFPY